MQFCYFIEFLKTRFSCYGFVIGHLLPLITFYKTIFWSQLGSGSVALMEFYPQNKDSIYDLLLQTKVVRID